MLFYITLIVGVPKKVVIFENVLSWFKVQKVVFTYNYKKIIVFGSIQDKNQQTNIIFQTKKRPHVKFVSNNHFIQRTSSRPPNWMKSGSKFAKDPRPQLIKTSTMSASFWRHKLA